tara:strand:- start:80 stop:1969 length:1890 start_codon:yes stop_codon:yes gene_type:complete
MKYVKFQPSKKFGEKAGPDDIQPWKDDQGIQKYAKEQSEGFKISDIQSGQDIVEKDVFTDSTATVQKDYKPQTPEAASQRLREEAGFDIDTEIELRQSIHDEYQGKKMDIGVKNVPGTQRKKIQVDTSESKPTVLGSKDKPFIDPFTKQNLTGKVGDLPHTVEGYKGMDITESRKAFKISEELSQMKTKRSNIIRRLNKEMYNIDYSDKVLTETDFKKALSVSKGEGIGISEAVLRETQTPTERIAEVGDVFEQKADYKATSAYDYSLVEEGNKLRDYQEDVKQNRFPDTSIEDRIERSGVEKGTHYPAAGEDRIDTGKRKYDVANLNEAANLSGSSMTGGGAPGLGWKQLDLIQRSVVPFQTVSVDNQATIPFAADDYSVQAKRILGPTKAKAHMSSILDKNIKRNLDDYNKLLQTHKKIEAAATEYAVIRKDIADTIGGKPTKANVEKYFTTKTGVKSTGAFRDKRSATIAGLDKEKMAGLPDISRKRLNMLKGLDEPSGISGMYRGNIPEESRIKSEGLKGTQQVVPNPQPTTRREAAYKKRTLSNIQRAEKLISTPPVALSKSEQDIRKNLKKAIAASGGIKAVKNLGKILGKSNPALTGLTMLPKKTFEDILNKSGIIYKKPEA